MIFTSIQEYEHLPTKINKLQNKIIQNLSTFFICIYNKLRNIFLSIFTKVNKFVLAIISYTMFYYIRGPGAYGLFSCSVFGHFLFFVQRDFNKLFVVPRVHWIVRASCWAFTIFRSTCFRSLIWRVSRHKLRQLSRVQVILYGLWCVSCYPTDDTLYHLDNDHSWFTVPLFIQQLCTLIYVIIR